MGEATRYPTIIDDMGGLHSHASEAFAAGKRAGRDEYYRALITALGGISVVQESGPVNGAEEKIATRGFHVAEACCKAARDIKKVMDDQKKTV